MGKKITHYILAFVFITFGLVQYNDPDFYIWGPLYIAVATVPILYAHDKLPRPFHVFLTLGIGIWMVTYVPDLIDWIKGGMDSIAESMKAESPHIELTREFFGLLLCYLLLITYYFLDKKRKKT